MDQTIMALLKEKSKEQSDEELEAFLMCFIEIVIDRKIFSEKDFPFLVSNTESKEEDK